MTPEIMTWDLPSLVVILPLLAAVAAFLLPSAAVGIGLGATALVGAASSALAARLLASGPEISHLGGWTVPLGIALRVDGFAALMLVTTAGIGMLVGLAASRSFAAKGATEAPAEERQRLFFWPLWLLLLAGLNALYLSSDVFNIYISLEILGLSAVGLAVLSGKAAALRAGLTYLFAGLLGSLLFLLGVDYLYAATGRVDLASLGAIDEMTPALSMALVLMLAGLAIKTALFPLHFWLPAAHSNATAPASALLSALVVKGSLYVALRLWVDVFAPTAGLGTLIGLLGAGAIVWGSIQAMRVDRLKLLVAYSTVAQIGLICLVFALTDEIGGETAWQGAVYLILAHAAAKSAMFLAVGRIAEHLGHDSLERLHREPLRPGMAQVAFALAAVSLIGLPPSAGFLGKWLLLEGAMRADAWLWVGVMVLGTMLSVAYLMRPISGFLRFDRVEGPVIMPSRLDAADLWPLGLAVVAIAMGLLAATPLSLLAVGSPFVVPEVVP